MKLSLNRFLVLATSIISIALSTNSSADESLYKWVDDKGVVNYSSSPPPKGQKANKIEVSSEPAISIPASDRKAAKAASDNAKASKAAPEAVNTKDPASVATQSKAAPKKPEADAAVAQRQKLVEQCEKDRGSNCNDENVLKEMKDKTSQLTPPTAGTR